MLATNNVIQRIEKLINTDKRYKLQAYLFIMAALDDTLKKLGKSPADPAPKRQVTGQELSHGIKDLAVREYGPMAKMVFENWGVRSTRDFGNIVYNLIGIGLMGKSETDTLDDFNGVFDFEQEFVEKYPFKWGDRS